MSRGGRRCGSRSDEVGLHHQTLPSKCQRAAILPSCTKLDFSPRLHVRTMTRSTRAIVTRDAWNAGGPGWAMEEVRVRKPRTGELLVEMVASGVCHTDLIVGGQPASSNPAALYPRVLGHEGSCYVVEVGPGVTVAEAGDPILCSYAFCGRCALCKDESYSHCLEFLKYNSGETPDGEDVFETQKTESIWGAFFGQSSFANYAIVKQCSVINVKGQIKTRQELQLFAPFGCGFQTGAGTVVEVAKPGPKDIVCIMGMGAVGLSAVMASKIRKPHRIIVVDRHEQRLQKAVELGATHVVNTSKLGDLSLIEAIHAVSDDLGPTITMDCTGVPPLITAGMTFTRAKGTYIQLGTPPPDFQINFNAFGWLFSGKRYVAAIEGQTDPKSFLPRMIQWYREGQFPVEALCEFFPAADFGKALTGMHDGSTIKPILCW